MERAAAAAGWAESPLFDTVQNEPAGDLNKQLFPFLYQTVRIGDDS